MTANEYAKTKFGSVVFFDVVEQDRAGFAKVFAQGSSALEALLLNVWSKGIKTYACGNDHVLILSKKDKLAYEHNAQKMFDSYVNARGIKKVLMSLHKQDYIPCHNAYISFDLSTIPAPEEFGRKITKAMRPYRNECGFEISRPKMGAMGGKKTFGIYFRVSREDEFRNHNLDALSDADIIQSSQPPADLFDKYFNIVNSLINEHFLELGLQAGVPQSEIVSGSDNYIKSDKASNFSGNEANELKPSLNALISSADDIKQHNEKVVRSVPKREGREDLQERSL